MEQGKVRRHLIALGRIMGAAKRLQPAIVAARLAAETGPMRLGITIYLLPLLNPVAVAEEAAALDVITGGRFILGAGLGYRAVEDEAFGLGQGERVPRLLDSRHHEREAILRVVRRHCQDSAIREAAKRKPIGSPPVRPV